MPAFSTHYIFAKELLPYIKENSDFEINESAYFYGAQGPDLFFFHRVLPTMKGKPLRDIGSRLHRAKPELTFNTLRDYCEKSRSDIAGSYVYGFITHYSLDRICHPYVYAKQEELVKSGEFTHGFTAHNEIEYSLDVYFLNKRMGIEKPYAFKTADTLSSEKQAIEETAKLLSTILPKVTGDTLSQKDGETAILDMIYMQSVLRDTVGFKRAFAKCADAMLKKFAGGFQLGVMIRTKDLEKAKKYANIDKKIWQSPYENGERNESVDELFELAKNDAINIFDAYKNGEDCKIITGNKSFLTGVEVI